MKIFFTYLSLLISSTPPCLEWLQDGLYPVISPLITTAASGNITHHSRRESLDILTHLLCLSSLFRLLVYLPVYSLRIYSVKRVVFQFIFLLNGIPVAVVPLSVSVYCSNTPHISLPPQKKKKKTRGR